MITSIARRLEWTSVESSNIQAIAYDGSSLYVRFNSDAIYRYSSVPSWEFTALRDADSKGTYFHENIKKEYHYDRIQ